MLGDISQHNGISTLLEITSRQPPINIFLMKRLVNNSALSVMSGSFKAAKNLIFAHSRKITKVCKRPFS